MLQTCGASGSIWAKGRRSTEPFHKHAFDNRTQHARKRRRTCVALLSNTEQELAGRRPLFQPFNSQSEKRDRMLAFRYEARTADGVLLIQPLTKEWLTSTTELLTQCFSDVLGYLPAYRTFLQNHILQYLCDHQNLPPKAIVLCALIVPNGFSSAFAEDAVLERSSLGDDGVAYAAEWGNLIGTVEVSYDQSTRTKSLTLNSPLDGAYLCNMGVDATYRRRGYGKLLLQAAEQVTREAGFTRMYLHLRFQDKPAASLYRQAGFVEFDQDWPLIWLLGQDRRYLMTKELSTQRDSDLARPPASEC